MRQAKREQDRQIREAEELARFQVMEQYIIDEEARAAGEATRTQDAIDKAIQDAMREHQRLATIKDEEDMRNF